MPESNKKRKREDDVQDIKRLLEQRKKAKAEHEIAKEITSELTPNQKNKAKSNKKGTLKKAVNTIDNSKLTLSQVQKELHEKAVPIVQDMMRIKLSEQETVKIFEEAIRKALQDLNRRSPDTRINVDNLTASIQNQLVQVYGRTVNQHAWIVPLASSLAVNLLGEMPYVGAAIRVGGNATAFVTTANELYKFYQKSEKTYTDYIKTLLASVGGVMAVADSYNLLRNVNNSNLTSSLLVSSSSKAKKVAARCSGLTGAAQKNCFSDYSTELLNELSNRKKR